MTSKFVHEEPAHESGRIMLAKHQAGRCGWGCAFCTREERARAQEAQIQAVQQAAVFEIMPRDVNAKGLEFQAGLYSPRNGGHMLIAEFHDKRYARHVADVLTLLASPLFEGIETTEEGGTALCRVMVKGHAKSQLWFPRQYLADGINEVADFIRRQTNPNLDRDRASVMQDHGLKGEWGAWQQEGQ